MATTAAPASWAVKYGARAQGSFGNKSGFSPTDYTIPALGGSIDPDIEAIEEFQRENLYGFTSRELGQLDCLPTRELTLGNLQNDIFPILRRENWETEPAQPDFTRNHLYPLSNGNGMWAADNDVVWDVMEPIVRLASRMLMSTHVMPWFDALLNGERRPIPEHRLHPDDKNTPNLEYFRARPSFAPEALKQQRDLVFERLHMVFRLKYGFMIAAENPEGPEKDAVEALGITVTNATYMLYDPQPNKSWFVRVFINLSQPEMLMRDGLNSTERMTIQWSIANTIIHETMHAIACLQFIDNPNPNKHEIGEPYFEDEPLAEVGFSFEAAINSGIPEHFLYDPDVPSPPLGYWLRRYWPAYCDIFARDPLSPILTAPGPLTYNEFFPIPILFYQDIQQEDFWSVVVRQFGNKVFHYRGLKEGARENYTVTNPAKGKYERNTPTRFTEQNHFNMLNGQFRSDVEALKLALNMTPDERKAMHFGQSLLISSGLEERFWTDSCHQEINIQLIANTVTDATRGPNTPEVIRQVFLSILKFTEQAITNHERMIAGILSLENANGVKYPDRRAKLLAWNNGTREFIRKLVKADFRGNLDVEAEELRMEQCWMALWNPHDVATQHGTDFLEIQVLQSACNALKSGDRDKCRSICTQFLQEDARSLFAQCAAQTFLLALDKDEYESRPERYVDLQKMLIRLASLKAAAPEVWKDEVLGLENEVTALIALQRPASPMEVDASPMQVDTSEPVPAATSSLAQKPGVTAQGQ